MRKTLTAADLDTAGGDDVATVTIDDAAVAPAPGDRCVGDSDGDACNDSVGGEDANDEFWSGSDGDGRVPRSLIRALPRRHLLVLLFLPK